MADAPDDARDGNASGVPTVPAVVRVPVATVGAWGTSAATATGGVALLVAGAAAKVPLTYFGRRGRSLAYRQLAFQLVRVGVNAVPVVSLVVFAIGAILSLQIVPILAEFGAQQEIARIIAIAMFRELGPLVGAIVLTGFAGASIAAEIGTMTVGEEIEAMETHAIDPTSFLVVPRVLATAVMTVCLAVVADVVGVAGGMTVTALLGDMPAWLYLSRSIDAITMRDFLTGLVKAFVFGTIISGLACYLGLGVRGGAQGVGDATTRTVVLTIVALAVVDLGFTWVFFVVGL